MLFTKVFLIMMYRICFILCFTYFISGDKSGMGAFPQFLLVASPIFIIYGIDLSHICQITSTPYAVLPLFATKFAACTGGNWVTFISSHISWGGWGCEVSCGGHHQPRRKTTTGSALDGAVFDITQILAYLIHNMSRSQLYLGFGHFGWLLSFFGQ